MTTTGRCASRTLRTGCVLAAFAKGRVAKRTTQGAFGRSTFDWRTFSQISNRHCRPFTCNSCRQQVLAYAHLPCDEVSRSSGVAGIELHSSCQRATRCICQNWIPQRNPMRPRICFHKRAYHDILAEVRHIHSPQLCLPSAEQFGRKTSFSNEANSARALLREGHRMGGGYSRDALCSAHRHSRSDWIHAGGTRLRPSASFPSNVVEGKGGGQICGQICGRVRADVVEAPT